MIGRRSTRRLLLAATFVSAGLAATAGVAAQTGKPADDGAKRAAEGRAGLEIRLEAQGQSAERRFVVTGFQDDQLRKLAAAAAHDPQAWHQVMVVTVVSDDAGKPLPMLGSYAIKGAELNFTPRFPLRAGTAYRARVFAGTDRREPTVSRDFALAYQSSKAPTRLTAVYPTSKVLPENQLKFYVHFSSAMSRGEAYRRIKLIDTQGQVVEFPFLELGEELWDPSGRRFTLFFDPGRIKRGLKPRELFGPALEAGRSYTLVIDRKWRDARGQPLQATHRKNFRVGEPDDKQPAPSDWQMVTPTAASRQPLVVSFGECMDHAMLQRVLTVSRASGAATAGRIVVSKLETQWSFQPDIPWQAGEYALVVDTALEDLAGNSIGRPFEVDMFDRIARDALPATVRIPFTIRP